MNTQDTVYKISSPAGMAALLEEHADTHSGAERLAVVLDDLLPSEIWNELVNRLAADIVGAVT